MSYKMRRSPLVRHRASPQWKNASGAQSVVLVGLLGREIVKASKTPSRVRPCDILIPAPICDIGEWCLLRCFQRFHFPPPQWICTQNLNRGAMINPGGIGKPALTACARLGSKGTSCMATRWLWQREEQLEAARVPSWSRRRRDAGTTLCSR